MKSNLVLIIGRRRGAVLLERLLRQQVPIKGCIIMQDDPHEEQWADRLYAIADRFDVDSVVGRSLRNGEPARKLKSWNPDIVVAENWRTLVPKEIYQSVRHFVIFHEALLPKYRGFAPLSWPIINGETTTGVTLFYVDEEVDSGDIIAQQAIPVGPDDTVNDLYDRTIPVYCDLLDRYLPMLDNGGAPKIRQDESQATYTCARTPEDGQIDWSQPTGKIYNLIRALAPPMMPGAWTTSAGERLLIRSATPVRNAPYYVGRIPGRLVRILDGAVWVLTGDGVMQLNVVSSAVKDAEPTPASTALRSLKARLGS
ncbi:MAG TPA: methionyl-tRNA formyltransferase [Bryobacteraceae bacterium]|nr:methionyl-tRNA formyltransferase [Bryobacteraceae bacterium]